MLKTIAKPVFNWLEKNNVNYEAVSHRRVFTAQDKAATLRIDSKQVVKSVVLSLGLKERLIASVPANKNIDLKKIKGFLNKSRKKNKEKLVAKIDFAKEVWMKKNLKSSEPGAVLPLGSFYGISHLIDGSLLKQKFLILNGGCTWQSLKITPARLIKLEGSFLQKTSLAANKPKKKLKAKKK